MSVDSSLISHVIKRPDSFRELQRSGITEDHFTDDYAKAWRWIRKLKKEHGVTPSLSVFRSRYPKLDIVNIRDRDLPILIAEIKKRKKYIDFLQTLEEASRVDSPEEIDVAIAELQSSINELSMRSGSASMVDLFSSKFTKRILRDQARRRDDERIGIPTGLHRFDAVTGGLQRGRMAVVMGRPGLGKSWLNLLFVAKAVMYGAKVGLYPLEMNLEDTALRLYSIFSSEMLGAEKALRNTDLSQGRISKQKITRFLNALEDKFKGQLFVADIGSMSDPYTVERIEAEQELHDFDLQWIDYITLMKAPGVGKNGQEDHTTVKALSNGCKQIAMRQNTVVGVSAQVSRQAISGNALLPRLEHIAYGDSIGQDADHVVSINRRGGDLYYGLVKNRHGPEIGKTRVRFSVNEGVISDHPNQIEEEE